MNLGAITTTHIAVQLDYYTTESGGGGGVEMKSTSLAHNSRFGSLSSGAVLL